MYIELPPELMELRLHDPIFEKIICLHEQQGSDYQKMLESAVMNLAMDRAGLQKQLLIYAATFGAIE